jgi:hypothetical protein
MGQSWGRRLSTAVPALVFGGALWLPWEGTAGSVYVIDGPSLSSVSTGLDNGFAVLTSVQFIGVLLAAAATVVVTFVSATAVRWVGAVSGVATSAIAGAALVTGGPAVGPVTALVAALLLLVAVARAFAGWRVLLLAGVVVLLVAGLATAPRGFGQPAGPADLVAGADFHPDARLVPMDGAVAVVDRNELLVAERGHVTRLATVEGRGVTVLGIMRRRIVYYLADAFELRIVPLDGGEPGVVTGVVEVDSMTATGIVLFRTAGVTIPTLRRTDVTTVSGTTDGDNLDEAPVPATRPLLETDDADRPMRFQEHPVTGQIVALDNTEMPHPDLMVAEPHAPRWRQFVGIRHSCTTPGLPTFGQVDAVTPDATDGWFLILPDEVAHVRDDGYMSRVRSSADGPAGEDLTSAYAIQTGADHALYVLDEDGLWRVPDPGSLVTPVAPARRCPPLPVVADPVRLDPVEVDYDIALLPDGSGGDWRRYGPTLEHRDAAGDLVATTQLPSDEPELWPDLTGAPPYGGRCPPTRLVGTQRSTPAVIPGVQCWDDVVIGRDGRGWAVAGGKLYSFGPAGVVELTHGGPQSTDELPATKLAAGLPLDSLTLASTSMALDASGTPLVLVDDMLLGATEQGVVLLGQDTRLRGATLYTHGDGAAVQTRDGVVHRLGY